MIFQTIVYGSVTVLNLITGLALLVFGVLGARTLSLSLRRLLREKLERESLEVFIKLMYYTTIAVASITALPMLGFQLSGLLVAGGVVGLAIGFASQNIVGNMIAGIILFIERPIKIGNAVSIDGVAGVVTDIQIMSTTLRGFDGLYVRLPNQHVFTAKITNFVSNVARQVAFDIGIRYTDDAEQAIALIKSIIEMHPMTLKNPAPQVFVDKLDESAVMLAIRFWTPTSEWFEVKTALLWTFKHALEQAGMAIPFPQRVVWLANDGRPSAKEPPVISESPTIATPPTKRRRRTTPQAS